jgi:hypothetical protein
MKGCADCKHHSTAQRRRALGVADGDLELVEYADEPATVYLCRHPSRAKSDRPIEMGLAEHSPGVDCMDFEEGTKKGLSPELEKLLARRSS